LTPREQGHFLPLLSPLNRYGLKMIRDVDVIDVLWMVLGIADPLACKGYVPECEPQDIFDETKA